MFGVKNITYFKKEKYSSSLMKTIMKSLTLS